MRDRQRIATAPLYALLALGLLPFLLMALRLVAFADVGPTPLTAPGAWLNQSLNLQWIGVDERNVVLYILILPLAGLLIALTRLTLGIRVLGFRSILIAIGMQEIGVLPCLLLIVLITATVILVRPSMRRSGMPLYARVAVVLCVVTFTMLGGLLLGAWTNSVTLWSMAFFPVVILAMLAESVADTVARDGLAMAVLRTISTVALALIIAAMQQFTALRELLLTCPEVLLTPLVLVIFISEFLDLRLFEAFQPFSRSGENHQSQRPVIALVRNRFPEPPPRHSGQEVPRRYRKASLQALIDQLRDRDYDVRVLECDSSLAPQLRSLANDAYAPRGAGLCVLNYSGGTQGIGRLSHVPVICEALGVPYTGPDAEAPALSSDRRKQLDALRAEGLGTPREISMEQATQEAKDENSTLRVRPRYQSDRGAIEIANAKQLKSSIARIEGRFGPCLIERIPAGRAITAVVQMPEAPTGARVLALLYRTKGRGAFKPLTNLAEQNRLAVGRDALRAARALGCRDAARVDLFLTADGLITIDRVLAVEPLTTRSAAGTAADLAGLQLADLAEEALRQAWTRSSTQPSGQRPDTTLFSSNRNNRSHPPCATSALSVTA